MEYEKNQLAVSPVGQQHSSLLRAPVDFMGLYPCCALLVGSTHGLISAVWD